MQVLERLFPLTEREPVLVVVTHRSEPDHPSWPVHRRALQDHAHRAQVLILKELPTRVERELLEALVGKGTLPADIERRVLTAADGNPFYLEELIRSLIDASLLVRQERGWRFKHGQPVGIPPTVERVIISRIDRLSPGARSAIQTASVLGRQFGLDLLEAVAGGNAALSVALSELVFLELLCEEVESVYRFKHALIQEAAYNNMLKRQRRELHERAAEAIVLLFSDHIEQHYGILAHHYRAGERLGDALRYFELAAHAAQRVHAVDATLENFSSAWEIAEELDSERRAALRLQVGKVRSQAGHIGDARQDFEAVLRTARESGDRTLEIEAMNELGFLLAGAVDYQEALPLLEQAQGAAADIGLREAEVSAASRLSVVYTNLMHLDLAISQAHRADEAARDIGDERLRGMALDALQVASVMVGDMATVGEVSEDLVRIHQHRGDLWYLQLALFQWAWVDMAAGRWERAEQRFSEGLAVNRSIDDRGNVSIFPAALCWLFRVKGDYGRAIRLGRQALELATTVGHTEFISWAAELIGWTLLEVFAVREALEYLEQALDTAHKAGARLELIRAACHLAFARWLAGDHSRAVQESAIAERWIGEVTAPTGRVYLQGADGPIALANLHNLRRDPARALELAGPVFDAALAADWHEIVAGAALVLGRAHGQMGETERASRALQIALERAERFAMPGLAWRARAELATLLRATAPRAAQDHASRSYDTITALSAAVEDDTIRAAFLAGAKAQLPKGES
jgi:tetratricopeptide (TPR) repeat protein